MKLCGLVTKWCSAGIWMPVVILISHSSLRFFFCYHLVRPCVWSKGMEVSDHPLLQSVDSNGFPNTHIENSTSQVSVST